MKSVESAKGRVVCQRFLAAVSLLGLSGCVSAVTDDEMAAAAKKPEIAAPQKPQAPASAAATQPGHYVDPAVASAAGAAAAPVHPQAPGTPAQAYGAAADIGGLATQPTAISAGTTSIYSSAAPAVVAGAPGAASNRIVPAVSSVYSAPVPAAQPQPVSAPAVPPAAQLPAEQHTENRQPVPGAVPVPQPASGQVAAVAGQPASDAAGEAPESDGKGVTLAAFFAGAAKKRLPKMIESGSADTTQVAALPAGQGGTMGIALSGRSVMSDEFDDAHLDEEDDQPTGLMKLASLSGLTRVSPNGLFLQTDHVEVGCFKPELVRMIKDVERHYNSPAIVTSGYRPPKGIRQGSKHYTCDAADIQIKGVSKWELATYLRSLPDRGGVGTYCHTESVHMDTGEPRDWNWRCRRTAARR
ncbi:D-Ala-D-Ala carboxypeptidase family metallohydrolase [uncultured Agrobacterium sp.]|uniref:D-Ala-D-Ala carboxypeptidase family metallohydrolase n=1 Tax=uncultured Agrobacterium sp. TaxID=157277 RepID=UPI0025E25FBA|nr:D-Ala-D-Ala carboxypeptidase family metallohydrolase [uncultured Agrobacterium sp.]